MTLKYADRVAETTTTTGTGTYALAGAKTGFQGFVAGIGSTHTCYYCCTDGTNWEVGLGTVTDATPDTLARTTILSSTNAGVAVDWAAGSKDIYCTPPASRLVVMTADGATIGDLAINKYTGAMGSSAPGISSGSRTIMFYYYDTRFAGGNYAFGDSSNSTDIVYIGTTREGYVRSISVNCRIATRVGLAIQAAAAQTANLQEWRDSSGNILASVSSTGTLKTASFEGDSDATAGNTRFLLYDVNTSSLQRVKVGANGTGPGGTGRALYIDNTP